jgi:hypothetical protein
MRPQFRVIFTVSLGKPWLWAQSKAGIRSVAPFFMKAAAASEPELSTVLCQIGRHRGPQTRPDAKQFTDQELKLDQHAMQFLLLLSSTGLAYRRCELARIDGEQIGARFSNPCARRQPLRYPNANPQKASIECLGIQRLPCTREQTLWEKYGRAPSSPNQRSR